MVGRHVRNILIALDQLVNAVFKGDPDETISSRLGKARETSLIAAFVSRVVNALFFWQKDHVKESIEPDEGKDAS